MSLTNVIRRSENRIFERISNSEKIEEKFNIEYKKVLEHRKKCPYWGRAFCLDCFGGGLSKFFKMILGVD